jgi:HAD superfamily hydrolase (TIGR01509 family)
MTGPVETVLFDIDETLCEYRRSGDELLALAFDDHEVEPFFAIDDYYARYAEFADHTDTIDDLRTECFAAIAADNDRDPALGRALADAYTDERDHHNVRALPGAREAVMALSDGHRMGVVTNGPPAMQSQKLAALGLDETFETVVHAGYDAPAKPDPAPFHRALSVLDGTPESSVHIGNSLSSDVAGAQAAGLQSVWLDDGSEPDPVPDHTLASMEELANPPWHA